jgi:heat shock protein HslJ
VGVNVRSGPGTNFAVLGVAQQGDSFEVLGRSADGQWWAVSAPTGPNGVGWVTAANVLVTGGESVPVIDSPAPPPPTPTLVAPSTQIPIATWTPIPGATATPLPQISFRADRTTINQGECATLFWSVQNVQGVWVYPAGQPFTQFPRAGEGSWQVCPTSTTTYEMRVLLRNGTVTTQSIVITVNQPTATALPPTATPVPPTPVPPTPEPPTPVPPTATAVPPTEVPPVSDPLNGTQWIVTNYNNGTGATRTVIEGTTLGAAFNAGALQANGGCNVFNGPYTVTGASIGIGGMFGGQVFCGEPEGIMEQEQQYIAALQSAATFTISGDTLELFSATGGLAVRMVR